MKYTFILQNLPKSEVIQRPNKIAIQEYYLKIVNWTSGVLLKRMDR